MGNRFTIFDVGKMMTQRIGSAEYKRQEPPDIKKIDALGLHDPSGITARQCQNSEHFFICFYQKIMLVCQPKPLCPIANQNSAPLLGIFARIRRKIQYFLILINFVLLSFAADFFYLIFYAINFTNGSIELALPLLSGFANCWFKLKMNRSNYSTVPTDF